MKQIRITNKQISNAAWLNASACNFNHASGIDLWSVSISDNLSSLAELSGIVKQDEMERASRFYQQKDKDRHIISRAALRCILGRYTDKAPGDLEFELGLNKKPFLKNNVAGIHFNISHSKNRLLLAVSWSAIGVDVEFVNPDFKFKILEDNFSSEEVAYIDETDSLNRFYKIWTRKEAITKATAQGLDCDLRMLPGLDGDHYVNDGIIASEENWMISSFNIDENYIGSIAHNPLMQHLRFFKLLYITDLMHF